MTKKIALIILFSFIFISNSYSYELLLGHHKVEYFADRLVFKVKKAGFDAEKISLGNGMYKVSLKNLASKKDAEDALQKIKILVPDVKAKIIP